MGYFYIEIPVSAPIVIIAIINGMTPDSNLDSLVYVFHIWAFIFVGLFHISLEQPGLNLQVTVR